MIDPPEEEIATELPVVIRPTLFASESDQMVTGPPEVVIDTEFPTEISPTDLTINPLAPELTLAFKVVFEPDVIETILEAVVVPRNVALPADTK